MVDINRYRNEAGYPVEVTKLVPLPVISTLAPRTAFGDVSTAEITPVIQLIAVYGFSDKIETFLNGDAAASIKDRQFNVTTGTSIQAGAAVLSRRRLTYKAGQGILCRFTALFENPQVGSKMISGLISATESFGFGFNSAGEFGIHHETDGVLEIQELTITTAATGAEDATVTVNGVGYTVPLTAGTIAHNAFEIASELNGIVPLYEITSNGSIITARADVSLPAGSFAFSSSTAVASWDQMSAGTLVDTSGFIKREDWNGDIFMPDFDPTMGNVYQISVQYLGFGAIRFFVEDSVSGDFDLVHTIRYANNNIVPSVINPSFRIGIFTANVTGTAAEGELRMSSAFGGLEGKNLQTEPSRATDVEGTVDTTLKSKLTIRNRTVFGDIGNRAEVKPLILSVGSEANKSVIIEVSIGAIHTGDQIFSYIDQDNSTIEVSTDNSAITNGRFIQAFVIPANGSDTFDLNALKTLLLPGEEMTIAARVISGGVSGAFLVAVVWQEDL